MAYREARHQEHSVFTKEFCVKLFKGYLDILHCFQTTTGTLLDDTKVITSKT